MDAAIRVNNTKHCELEFDVNIQGISVDNPENGAQVRFVITNVHGGDLVFKCDHREDNAQKWVVKLPPLPALSTTTDAHMFRIEVIVDGYYFEPASGNLVILRDPEVSVSKTAKPKVSVNVTEPVEGKNKDEDKPKKTEKKEKEPVEERLAQAAGFIDSDTPPTTNNLQPEFPPDNDPQGDERMKGEHRRMPEDEDTDEEKLAADVPLEPEEDQFESAVRETFGKVKKPETQGFLFKRAQGKPVIEGVEPDQATKDVIKRKSDAVKAALR